MPCCGIKVWLLPPKGRLLVQHLIRLFIVLVSSVPMLATAQTTIYKQRDSQGRLVFSDRPISLDAQASIARAAAGPASEGASTDLPPTLRDVVSRYPVTLYTAKDCLPCDNGRKLLLARGIPHSEKTVLTPEDGQALTKLSGGLSVPLLTIGSQQLKGFSETSWTDYLSAAGYPARNTLPASYQPPAPRPMVELASPKPAEQPEAAVPPAATGTVTPQPSGPTTQNPAGIIF